MLRNRIIYFFAVLACFIFSIAYVGKLSQILLFVVLFYPVLALVITVIQLFFVKAEFHENRLSVQKEFSFDLIIRVYNTFLFPAVPLEMICCLPDGDAGVFVDKRMFIALPPFGKADIAVRCRHKFRGSFMCVIKRLYVVDPLRIIRVSKKFRCTLPMVFTPRKLELEDLIFKSAVEQSYAEKQLHSADKEDFSHVREYRTGDILQSVHWKLTAKQDELMVKQFDSVNDLRAVILCDYDQKNDELGMTRADMMIETAIAFAKTALDKGIHSTVDFGDLSAPPPFISDKGSFDLFFETLSVIPPDLDTADIITMFDRVNESSSALLAVITDKLSHELLERARNAAQQVTVIYVYLNIQNQPLEINLTAERFLFLNVRGTSENALNNAIEQSLIVARE